MKYSNVYKVVIMEGSTTSSNVWCQFIKADSNYYIEQYVKNSDCEIIYLSRLPESYVEFLDKGIDELVNGEMIYHS